MSMGEAGTNIYGVLVIHNRKLINLKEASSSYDNSTAMPVRHLLRGYRAYIFVIETALLLE